MEVHLGLFLVFFHALFVAEPGEGHDGLYGEFLHQLFGLFGNCPCFKAADLPAPQVIASGLLQSLGRVEIDAIVEATHDLNDPQLVLWVTFALSRL